MLSVWEARKIAIAELAELQSEDYSSSNLTQEVDLLLRYLLKCENLVIGPQFLTSSQLADLQAMLLRRKQREPLQHILGEAYFYGLTLAVGPGCFIPRPETETLVEKALQHCEKEAFTGEQTYHIYDLCAGSGAIILALMYHLFERQKPSLANSGIRCVPDYKATGVLRRSLKIRGLAVEKSAAALSYTRQNLQKYPELSERITLLEEDATSFNPLVVGYPRANLILCNPPYVALGDIRQAEAHHDPQMALYGGGEKGLEIPLQILDNLDNLLAKQGTLIMEHAEHQGKALVSKALDSGFETAQTIRDLTGAERFLLASGYSGGR